MNLLTDHRTLQLLLKGNRAHKQYSARITRWLDRLSHFDVNVQNTVGKNNPLTDYLSRHPIAHSDASEINDKTFRQEETEAEEKFVINQIYGLFDFNRTVGSITQFIEQTTALQQTDQSQREQQMREQHRTGHSFETSLNSINLLCKQPLKVSMDKVNGMEMEFIFKKGGNSPETDRLRKERNRILKPDSLRIVGRGRENEKLQEYQPSQQGRKQVKKQNIEIYNRFFNYRGTLGTTPLHEYQTEYS